jgi:diadenosine tetraphosphate (Ap4A) HIT family hydrolase
VSGDGSARDASCIFCSIAAGDAPAERVLEDDLTVAFMDISPATDGHVLVIPRRHQPDVFALVPPETDAVWHSTLRVAHAVRDALRPDGMNIHQSNGRIANQHVMHFHLHVIPRYATGGTASRSRIPDTAARIRDALSSAG